MHVAPAVQGPTRFSVPSIEQGGADAPAARTSCLDDTGLREVVANSLSSTGVPPFDTPAEVAGELANAAAGVTKDVGETCAGRGGPAAFHAVATGRPAALVPLVLLGAGEPQVVAALRLAARSA